MGNKFGAFLVGGLTGAVLALLYAPRSGQETRAMVSDRINIAWGEAQEMGSQAAENMQRTYQSVASKGQHFAQEAQTKGQAIYNQASACVQEAADNIRPAFSQKNDELREKIEAARQRIAAQVAKNADEDKAAVVATPVVDDVASGAAKDVSPKANDTTEAAQTQLNVEKRATE